MIGATRCPDCGSFVPRNIYFDRMGKNENAPLWLCPICGAVHEDHRWYKYVNQREAIEIIEHRGRRGLFVQEDGATYIGIDNSTGDAWVEEFPDLTECLMWLAGCEREPMERTEKLVVLRSDHCFIDAVLLVKNYDISFQRVLTKAEDKWNRSKGEYFDVVIGELKRAGYNVELPEYEVIDSDH